MPSGTYVGPGHPTSQASAAYPMAQSSAAYPVSQTSAPYPVSQASAYEPDGPQKAFPLKWLAAAAIILALLTGVGLFAASEWRRNQPHDPPAPTALVHKQAAPGWQPTYAWSRLVPQVPTGINVVENRVLYVDTRGALNVLDADTGRTVVVHPQPKLSSAARPLLVELQGARTIVVADGENLYLYPFEATAPTEPKVLTLPTGARSYTHSGGLMVIGNRQQWVATGAGQLKPVDLPADSIALGASPDGFLVAGNQKTGRWTFIPPDAGQASREVQPERTPEGTVGGMHVARLSQGVVASWGDTADPARKTLGLYDSNTGRLLAGATVDESQVRDLSLAVAPGRRLASAGPVLARLDDGAVQIAERWSPKSSDAGHLWGVRDGLVYLWNGEGPPVPLDARMPMPWGGSQNGSIVIVEIVDADRVVLGALKKD